MPPLVMLLMMSLAPLGVTPDVGAPVPVMTRPPELIQFAEAEYPAEARAAGLSASVRLHVTIDADGQVSDAQVVAPAGHGFDEAALAAVKVFRFSPAEVDGAPAAVQIEYVYNFALEPAKAPAPLPAVLKGHILSRGSRSRVESASIRCAADSTGAEALSDSNGFFELVLPAGECALTIIGHDHQPLETRELLVAGETLEVIYHLLPRSGAFETVVRGQRERKEVVRRTLHREELQKAPGTFGDPLRVIQSLPGVARAPSISGDLIVRGASPNQTVTLLDCVRVPMLYHLGAGPSVVNGEFLDRVDFYPGGFGARFGRAVGGVVDVTTRKGASDTLHGSAKIDLLDSGFFVEAPVGPGVSVAAAARRSYLDGLLSLVAPQGSAMAIPSYWDYQVRADFGGREVSTGNQSTFYVMAFGADDVVKEVSSEGLADSGFHTTFHRVKGDWTYRRGGFTSVLAPYVGYDLSRADYPGGTTRNDSYSAGLREDLSLVLSQWLELRTGLDLFFEHRRHDSRFGPLDDQRTRHRTNSFDGAAYIEGDLKAGALTVTPGVRATRSRVGGNTLDAVDPRLWMKVQAATSTTVKGSVGLFSQLPDAERFQVSPNLTVERALQASVGIEQRLGRSVTVDFTGYFNRRFDNIVAGDHGYDFVNELLGRSYGAEVMVRHDVSERFSGWIAYTLNRSEERRVGGAGYRLSEHDQTHSLTAVGSLRLTGGWEVGARFRLVSGRPHTPLRHQGDLYSVDMNSYSETRGPELSDRLATFHQLDVRVEKRFAFESWTLTAYLDVQNAYNHQNVESTQPDYRFRSDVATPGIPLLPVLGVKGSF